MGLFGKSEPANPRDKVREWARKLRQEQRQLDRQVNGIQREEEKIKRSIKEAAKKGDLDVCKVLAKQTIQSRKAVSRLYTSKAQINSVVMSMNQQVAAIRMAGALQQSAEVMKNMQSLVRIPEIAATMRELSKEMMKAGIIEEMIEDTMEGMEPEELEEEAQGEVDKILAEILGDQLATAPSAIRDSLPAEREAVPGTSAEASEDMSEMQARLEALRN